jgi:Protein of unknown function (DUF3011)
MRTFLARFAFLLLFPAVALGQAVPCESLDGTMRECRVGSSGVIHLTYEFSDNRCIEGVTWGTRMAGVVYVTRGCRAMFVTDDSLARGARSENRVVCESVTGAYTVCPARTAAGVALSRQLSMSPCVEESTWGYNREKNQIWVDDGCRGEFILGPSVQTPPPPALSGVVVCQSLDGKRVECKADTSAGVQIIRSFNEVHCGYGHEWGFDRKGVWVNNGCRAAFAVRGTPKTAVASVTCESIDGARNVCGAETHFGVALVRQLSESACVLDQSWGFDRDGIWVSNGCRAQFALGGYRLPSDALPPAASRVICDSLDGKKNVCSADTTRGVGLLRQIGDVDCVLNRTWGYTGDSIWVSEGCNAEFAVGR